MCSSSGICAAVKSCLCSEEIGDSLSPFFLFKWISIRDREGRKIAPICPLTRAQGTLAIGGHITNGKCCVSCLYSLYVFRCHNAVYIDCFVCLDKLIKFFFLVCLLPDFHSGEIKISISIRDTEGRKIAPMCPLTRAQGTLAIGGHITTGKYDWTCASFGPLESITQTANRSFLYRWP